MEKPLVTNEASSGTSDLTDGLGAWLPIETAPRDGTVILGYWCDEYGGDYGITCYETPDPQDASAEDSGEWIDASTFDKWVPPNYWMPLPKAPNVKVQRDSGSIIAGGSAGTTGCAAKVAE